MNHYSPGDASHFWHVLHLLEELAGRGVSILLLIEKADGVPSFTNPAIRVQALRTRLPGLRHLELLVHLRRAVRAGYTRIFVRIAMVAALCAKLATTFSDARVYFWQSGTVHAFDRAQPASLEKLRWWLTGPLPFFIVRNWVDCFVTGPESMIAYYRDQVGVRAEKLRLLYNDVDVGRFAAIREERARAGARAALGIGPDQIMLLFVHRFSPVRRTMLYMPDLLERVLRAADVPPSVLVVAGGGPELPLLRQMVAARGLGDRVRFLGEVANRRIHELYGAADVFVHPTYNEGFPRVVLEAMAAGLPMVSTDAGGTRDLVGARQRELVVARDDASGFAERLLLLLRDAPLRGQVAAENAEHVQRFSTPRVARMYDEVLFT